MKSASSNAGTPAQPKDTSPTKRPNVFEWYENKVEEGLQVVYRHDVGERHKIIATIREMDDSTLFWKLLRSFADAYDSTKEPQLQHEVLTALCARVYIAGSLRSCAVFEEAE